MPASPIRKLVPFAEAAKKRGIRIYHLNIGQPDIKTPETFLNAIKNAPLPIVEYTHSAGNESYRKKLCSYYKKFDIQLSPSDIMITTGGSEAIQMAMLTCFNPGDEIIVPEPFYANYNGFGTSADLVVKPVRSFIENGFALPPLSEFEAAITSKTKGIMICNPGNPTGYLYRPEELKSLAALVKKYDLYLLSDEVYREFCYDGQSYFSVLQLQDMDQHVVMLDSISKRYSACGARVGAFVTKNPQLMAAALKFAQARLSPPTYGQIGAEAALDTPDSYFKEVKEEYIKRRNILVEALNAMPGVFCPMPGGAFYAIARLPIDDADRFCQWLLESFNHQQQTLMLAPATGFYASPGAGKNEVRLAYVLNETDLRAAMQCLAKALQEYPGKTLT